MLILWIALFTPTLVLTIPVEKSSSSLESTTNVPGPVSGKPFIGIGAGWNPFYNTGRDFQVKADEGISGIVSELGGIMTAMSNIFDIFGPTKKINPKSYGNSPSSDEVEFIGPVEKFLGMFGGGRKCKNCTNSGGEMSTERATMETDRADVPTTVFTEINTEVPTMSEVFTEAPIAA